jgi:hypothetical protein
MNAVAVRIAAETTEEVSEAVPARVGVVLLAAGVAGGLLKG